MPTLVGRKALHHGWTESAHARAGGSQTDRGRPAAGRRRRRRCRLPGVELSLSEQTYYRWRNQFGGLKAQDAKRLRELEAENARLKRLLSEADLEKDVLREIAKGEF